MQVFVQDDGTYDGYCYACGTRVDDPYHDKPVGYKPEVRVKTPEEIEKEIAEALECEPKALPDRKLGIRAMRQFDIRVGVSTMDGVTPTLHFYPFLLDGVLKGFKVRHIKTKKMWNIGDIKGADFFGWEQAKRAGGRRLFITEGELDAASLYTIIKREQKGTQWEEFEPSVVSLTSGASSAKAEVGRMMGKIRQHFDQVCLVFDDDEPGRKAVEEVLHIAPDFIVATLPCKDANECLMQGFVKAAFKAIQFRAEKPKNSRLVWGESLHEAAKEQAAWGLSYPWDNVTELTRGMRFGETIYIGAAQKMGKSEIVNELAMWCIKEHGLKVMVAKPEEANKKTYKLMAGKCVGKVFHDPKVQFDEDAYEIAGEILHGNLCMLNLYQNITWEVLQGDIRAAAAEGCKAVFVDPITNLTNGMNAADANVKLQEIAQELAAMALDLDIIVFIFCHLRNPDGGLPHDRGGAVLTSQFAGSRAMGRSCNYIFGLEGNKDPELPEEQRNFRDLVLLDDREYGEVGKTRMYWSKFTTLFTEVKE